MESTVSMEELTTCWSHGNLCEGKVVRDAVSMVGAEPHHNTVNYKWENYQVTQLREPMLLDALILLCIQHKPAVYS